MLWHSQEEIRDRMVRYYGEHPLSVSPDGNWKVVPEAARRTLVKEALAEAARQHLQ